MAASSLIATMSGRGVITSRTSASPKSTMLCRRRRSSPSMRPSCSPVSRYAFVAWLASSAASSGATVCAARRTDTSRAIPRVSGPRALAIGANVGSSTSSTRSGSRPTMASGRSSSQTTTNSEFPSSSGPNSLTINNSNGVALNGAKTINGTLTLQ